MNLQNYVLPLTHNASYEANVNLEKLDHLTDEKSVTITIGTNIRQPEKLVTANLDEIINRVTNPFYKELVEAIRSKEHKTERNQLKYHLPHFMMGEFDGKRANDKMINMVGLVLDYDGIQDPFHYIQKEIPKHSYIWGAFISPSGMGIKIIMLFDRQITKDDEFRGVYLWTQKIMDKALGITSDNTPDCARACFFSYDPSMYVNANCKRLEVDKILSLFNSRNANKASQQITNPGYREKDKKSQDEATQERSFSPRRNDVETGTIDNRNAKGVVSFEDDFEQARDVVSKLAQIAFDYKDFIKVGLALYSGFGEKGKELWDILKDNPNYHDSQSQMDIHWRSFRSNRNTNLGSLYYVGKKYGIN